MPLHQPRLLVLGDLDISYNHEGLIGVNSLKKEHTVSSFIYLYFTHNMRSHFRLRRRVGGVFGGKGEVGGGGGRSLPILITLESVVANR